MPLRTLVLLLACGGCFHRIRPETTISNNARATVPGEPLSIDALWAATCTKTNWHKEDDIVSCDFKPVELTVWCDGACKVTTRTSDSRLHRMREAIPLALGPLTVHARSTRVDAGEQDVRSLTVQVVAPDRVELDCLLDGNASERQFGPCGPAGVAAVSPLLRPRIRRDGLEHFSYLLELNDRQVGVGSEAPTVSLADLFPDARQGSGIAPGTYVVDVALAGVKSRFQVVAR